MKRGRATLVESDERQLIARLRARNLEALGELYRRLGSAMATLARSMLGSRADAEDVVEEALLRIHDAAPAFRGERGLRTWSLRIVANLCRDRLRRRRFDAGDLEDLAPHERAGLGFHPVEDWDRALDQQKVGEALERAIQALPADQREAVVLRHRIGLSHVEMVEVLGVPEGTVKSRLGRALAALRQDLKERLR